MKKLICGLMMGLLAFAGTASAATLAEDSANNYTSETFINGANLGTGFAAWEFWNTAPSLTNSAAGLCGDINSENGLSFRFAGTGNSDWCNGYRGFTALNTGDVLTFRFTCAYCGGGRGLDLFANSAHEESDKIGNVINLSGDNLYSVNGTVVASNWAPGAISEVTLTQQADGLLLNVKRTLSDSTVDVDYTTNIVTSSRLTGIGLYAGGWSDPEQTDINNYAFFVNDLKIEGEPPTGALTLAETNSIWAITSATGEAGQALSFVVTRDNADAAVTVNINSSSSDFVTLEVSSVTMEAGVTSATFAATANLMANAQIANISVQADGYNAPSAWTVKGPNYSHSATSEVYTDEPWKIDLNGTSTLWINNTYSTNDFPVDNSKITVSAFEDAGLTLSELSGWSFNEDGTSYANCTVTASGGGEGPAVVYVRYDGLDLLSYEFTVVSPGLSLSGPASMRVGSSHEYTVAVHLIPGETGNVSLSSNGITATPLSYYVDANTTLTFQVSAANIGQLTLSTMNTANLDEDTMEVNITAAPEYADYIAYDDAAVPDYAGGFVTDTAIYGSQGFSDWTLESNNDPDAGCYAGVFLENCTIAGMNEDNKCFGMYANGVNNPYAKLLRSFPALSDGQAFHVDLGYDWSAGTKGFKLLGSWVAEEVTNEWSRFEFYNTGNNTWSYKLNNDETNVHEVWNDGENYVGAFRASVTVMCISAAEDNYTLTFQRNLDTPIVVSNVNLSGTVDHLEIYYSGNEGAGDPRNNLYFNRLFIEQVIVPPETIYWSAGVWNPDEQNVPYTFEITPSALAAIGLVDLSISPSEGVELSTNQVDVSAGSASFTLTITGDIPTNGPYSSYTITADPQTEGIASITYTFTPRPPSCQMRPVIDNTYTYDYVAGGTIGFRIFGTPSRVGETVVLDSDNSNILAPPSPATATVVGYDSTEGIFYYTMPGLESSTEPVDIHAKVDEVEWGSAGITINGGESGPVIGGNGSVVFSGGNCSATLPTGYGVFKVEYATGLQEGTAEWVCTELPEGTAATETPCWYVEAGTLYIANMTEGKAIYKVTFTSASP